MGIIRTLHPYQERDLQTLFEIIEGAPAGYRVLYQLPTGGGKTVVFSEIAKRFREKYARQVAILTHRNELSKQTSSTLKALGVDNKIISATTRELPGGDCACYVAMVETLRNRLRQKLINPSNVGLVIIDEAHNNSFRKLLKSFPDAIIIGVTATPFNSDAEKPLRKYYRQLVVGESISSLIGQGFLAKPETLAIAVEQSTLKTGITGDYTVSSSNDLYGSPAMQQLLLETYQQNSARKKTLIFNNGIESSLKVLETFTQAGIAIRHLDNRTPAIERKEILSWFKSTKGAVLTSVSILTTGFDEPSVQSVILFRATTSISLYHQMVGRGSRRLSSKKTFRIIDLGNNAARFSNWEEPVDWKFAFERPGEFAETFKNKATSLSTHAIPAELRAKFPKTLEFSFDVEAAFADAIETGDKTKNIIRASIRQHALMCIDNSDSTSQAVELASALGPEIEWRVKQYVKCLDKATQSYKEWLLDDYTQRLEKLIRKAFLKLKPAA